MPLKKSDIILDILYYIVDLIDRSIEVNNCFFKVIHGSPETGNPCVNSANWCDVYGLDSYIEIGQPSKGCIAIRMMK